MVQDPSPEPGKNRGEAGIVDKLRGLLVERECGDHRPTLLDCCASPIAVIFWGWCGHAAFHLRREHQAVGVRGLLDLGTAQPPVAGRHMTAQADEKPISLEKVERVRAANQTAEHT